MSPRTPTRPPAAPRAGTYVLQEDGERGFWAFEPAPLPPDPSVLLDEMLAGELDRASRALGRLDGLGLLLPDPDMLVYSFVRKEAVLSSQIEGTQSSLSDLLAFENDMAPGVPEDDVQETSNYIAAMKHGLDEVSRPGGLPISSRLLREIHAILLRSGRGSDKAPGEFRRSQNWIGGTRPGNARFVPPPWISVAPAMSALEHYIHDDEEEQRILIKTALAHVQMETIHPFLDGNGRVGRLLITLLIASEGALRYPLLYLSLYFKRHRDAYYDYLGRVRTDGDWEAWLAFFLEGVNEVAQATTETAEKVIALVNRDTEAIDGLGRAARSAHLVHDWAARHLVVEPSKAAAGLELARPTVYDAIARLEDLGILREATDRRRDRLWAYSEYLDLMSEGTEPL